MIKTLTIESATPDKFLDLQKLLKHADSKCYIEKKLVYCDVNVDDKEEYIPVIFNIAVLMLLNYVSESKLCKTDKEKSHVLSHVLHNPDFRYAITMDLYYYFENNTHLKETSYFMFNMKGLKEDITLLLKALKKQEEFEVEKKNARENLKKHGKKTKDYKQLALVDDTNNGFALLAKNGEKIDVDTLDSEFGIVFKIDERLDIEKYIATFVALTCSILNTRVLDITPSFIPIYEDIVSAFCAIQHDIDINIYEDADDIEDE